MRDIFIKLIKFYQKNISPYLSLYQKCKFEPTCSNYAIEAFEKYGTIKGLRLTICRLIRCHPFTEGGYDPVP